MQAIEAYEEEDKLIYSNDTFKMTENLLLKNQKYSEAVKLYTKHAKVYETLNQKQNQWKAHLTIVVVLLHMDDYVTADATNQEFLQVSGYISTEESRTGNDLLDAYEKGDSEALQKITKKQIFNYLDNAAVRIAKGLKVSGAEIPTTKPQSKAAAALFAPQNPTTTTTTTSQEDKSPKANYSNTNAFVGLDESSHQENKFVGLSEASNSKPNSTGQDKTSGDEDSPRKDSPSEDKFVGLSEANNHKDESPKATNANANAFVGLDESSQHKNKFVGLSEAPRDEDNSIDSKPKEEVIPSNPTQEDEDLT